MRKAWLSWGGLGRGAGSQPCPLPKSESLRLLGKGHRVGRASREGVFPEKQQGGTCAVCLLFGSWLAQPERLLPAYSTRPLSPPNRDRHPLAHSHLHNHSLQTVGPPTPSQTHGAYGSRERLSHEESPMGPQYHHSSLNLIFNSRSQS